MEVVEIHEKNLGNGDKTGPLSGQKHGTKLGYFFNWPRLDPSTINNQQRRAQQSTIDIVVTCCEQRTSFGYSNKGGDITNIN